MNTRLLRAIQKRIDDVPARVAMGEWFSLSTGRPNPPECGTVGCIAGLAISIREGKRGDVLINKYQYSGRYEMTHNTARGYLHLTYSEGNRLFHASSWPEKFRIRLDKAREGSKQYARAVSDRIDHFIETGGAE